MLNYFLSLLSPATIGGIFLIIGAFFLFFGKANYSVISYFFADLCWVDLAYHSKDYFGMTVTIIGMMLGIGVFLKMQLGYFHKNLKKDKK